MKSLINVKTIARTDVKTDTEVIEGYLNGTITGIYIRQDSFFINLRVTGLGITRRLDEEKSAENLVRVLNQFKDLKEQTLDFTGLCKLAKDKGLQPLNYLVYRDVDRREQEFANPKTLEMYAGLPILIDHPKEGLLSYNNLSYNAIVGSVIKAYKLNNAVFAIARIYDLSLLDKLDEFKSTSPAVVSIDVEDNGQTKELPIIFNHLAFVKNGHWDQISDYAIDGSKIQIEGDNMAITDVIEANKVDAITDVVATPEAKEVKTDNDEAKVESQLSPATIEADNIVEVNPSEVEEVETDADTDEAKADTDEVKADTDEVKADTDEVKADTDEVKADDEVKIVHPPVEVKTEADLTKEAIDEGITDVTKSVECDEDKERENLINTMRKTVDAASTLKDVQMPYIEGRKKPSFVIKALLRSNRQYVDSKFQGIIDSDVSYKNYALCIDAFNNMLDNIRKADEANHSYVAKAETRGWTIAGDNPNILVDKNF